MAAIVVRAAAAGTSKLTPYGAPVNRALLIDTTMTSANSGTPSATTINEKDALLRPGAMITTPLVVSTSLSSIPVPPPPNSNSR